MPETQQTLCAPDRAAPPTDFPNCQPYLTEREVAAMLSVAPQTLRRWRMEAARGATLCGPRFLRIGRRSIRYLRADVERYTEQQRALAAAELGISA